MKNVTKIFSLSNLPVSILSVCVCVCLRVHTLEIRNFKEGNFHRRERTALNNVGSNVGKHGNVIRRATLQTNRKVTNCGTLNCATEYEITRRYKECYWHRVTKCYERRQPPPPLLPPQIFKRTLFKESKSRLSESLSY